MSFDSSPVLLYHEVDVPEAAKMPNYNVSPTSFRRQLEQLLEHGLTLVTVTELMNRIARGERPDRIAAVTFDDGFRSFLDHALPVLNDLDVPATMYVTTRWNGTAPGWLHDADGPTIMSAVEVGELAETTVEIGGHTHSHLHLDLLRPGQARHEIEHNKLELEALIGQELVSFAYPHGSHNKRVRDIVEECGYGNACAVNGPPIVSGGDEFRIGRIVVDEDTDMAELTSYQQRLQRQYPNGRTSVATAAARHAYRAARRARLHRHHQTLLRTR